jgi:hypothetical protein
MTKKNFFGVQYIETFTHHITSIEANNNSCNKPCDVQYPWE